MVMTILFLLAVLLLLASSNLSLETSAKEVPLTLSRSYEILNVTQTSTIEEIKSSYRTLSKSFHPDKNSDKCKESSDCSKKQVELNEAYSKVKYRRKNEFPELHTFFGYSEHLFNIVEEIHNIFNLIPQSEKDRFQNILNDYLSSDSLHSDLTHTVALVCGYMYRFAFVGGLRTLFWLCAMWNVCAFVGFFWFFLRFWRMVTWVMLIPFRVMRFVAVRFIGMKGSKKKME